MTPAELVERVARAISDCEYPKMKPCKTHFEMATAAVAIALEEAAKQFGGMWGGITPDEAAFRIRALIPSGNIPAHHDNADSK